MVGICNVSSHCSGILNDPTSAAESEDFIEWLDPDDELFNDEYDISDNELLSDDEGPSERFILECMQKRITSGFGITLDHILMIVNVVSQIMGKYKLGKQYFLQMMIMSSFPYEDYIMSIQVIVNFVGCLHLLQVNKICMIIIATLHLLVDGNGHPHHLCLAAYHIPDGFKPQVKPHGNAKKSSAPFYPTWASTMQMVKQESQKSRPKDVVASVSAKGGGMLGALAPGQLPRGEAQVSHAKCTIKFQENHGNELFLMMQRSKSGEEFVCHIKTCPNTAIVVANNRQLDDLVRFCSTPPGTETSILTIDTTYCLGDFECTPITYWHLLLTTQRYN